MLIEDAKIIESLWRIVSRLAGDSAMQKDLMQEALVRLWRLENEKPGRTRSWYLQNCRFHLQHWLALGRSLDSLKRANGDNRVVIDTVAYEEPLEGYDTNGELFDLVCAKDFVSTLSRHLKPRESAVLGRLADGMVLHDVALQLNLSYPTVLKYRRKIASLAIKLGIAPATSCHHTHGRRKIDDNEIKSSATVNKINGTRQSNIFTFGLSDGPQAKLKFNGKAQANNLKPVDRLTQMGRSPNQAKCTLDRVNQD